MYAWFPCVVGVGKKKLVIAKSDAKPQLRRGTFRCIANYSRISSCMSMLIASSALHLISGGQAICLFFLFCNMPVLWFLFISQHAEIRARWEEFDLVVQTVLGLELASSWSTWGTWVCEWQRLDETRKSELNIQSKALKQTEYERSRFTCCEVFWRGWSAAWHDLAPSKTLITDHWSLITDHWSGCDEEKMRVIMSMRSMCH